MPDDFLQQGYDCGMPASQRPFTEEWIKYIVEYHMPDIPETEKQEIVGMLKPIVDVAAKSNILRREIPLHLDGYDIIWDKYFMYMKEGKYDPRLLILKESLREGFELQLCRSVDAVQMRMIFEPKQSIFQSIMSKREKIGGFFKTKKDDNQEVMR